jgi:hypothetical protein
MICRPNALAGINGIETHAPVANRMRAQHDRALHLGLTQPGPTYCASFIFSQALSV